MKTVTVNAKSSSYDILIGSDILKEIPLYLQTFDQINKISIVTDDVISKFHLANLCQILKTNNLQTNVLTVKAGEKSKSWSNLKKVTEWLIENKVERRDFVIGLGGGVIGDLVGFAASIVRRGIKVIHIPSSLLAQVDSAIGGKTSINSIFGKNLIGTFYQPTFVLSDVSMLRTLKKRDFRSGYGEVVKYALIREKSFFNWLEKHDFSSLMRNEEHLIYMVKLLRAHGGCLGIKRL